MQELSPEITKKYSEINILSFGEPIYIKKLYGTSDNSKHGLNQTCNFVVCKGKSKDFRFPYYPYWSIELIQQDNKLWTPTKELIMNILLEILKHEYYNDVIRKRKPDLDIWQKKLDATFQYFKNSLQPHIIPGSYLYDDKLL